MPLPRQVFCDTSFFYACLDPADTHHPQGRDLVDETTATRVALWTTWDVVSEVASRVRWK